MMYIKEFDRWNKSKKSFENRLESHVSFRERDVWWCSIGVNLGSEEDGKNDLFERPVLVVRKFNRYMAWVIPMSTKVKYNQYHFHLVNETIMLSQLRTVSVKRFNRFVDRISTYDFSMIRSRASDLLRYD